MAARVLFTVVAMFVVVSMLRAGNPVGGLVIVPLLAMSIRRAAEGGRLRAFVSRF